VEHLSLYNKLKCSTSTLCYYHFNGNFSFIRLYINNIVCTTSSNVPRLPSVIIEIRVITKLPNSEQSYKGKVKTHNYINKQNQSTTENCERSNSVRRFRCITIRRFEHFIKLFIHLLYQKM
jgi:hypothetical protein